MPSAALVHCPRCRGQHYGGCSMYKKAKESARAIVRGTSTGRGYDAEYRRIRKDRFDPESEHYESHCHICRKPGMSNDVLDHAFSRESTYENLHRAHYICNARKAGRMGGAMRSR